MEENLAFSAHNFYWWVFTYTLIDIAADWLD